MTRKLPPDNLIQHQSNRFIARKTPGKPLDTLTMGEVLQNRSMGSQWVVPTRGTLNDIYILSLESAFALKRFIKTATRGSVCLPRVNFLTDRLADRRLSAVLLAHCLSSTGQSAATQSTLSTRKHQTPAVFAYRASQSQVA